MIQNPIRRAMLVALSCGALVATHAVTATAADLNQAADETAQAIADVAPPMDVVAPTAAEGYLIAETDDGSVAIPVSGSGEVAVAPAHGVVPVVIALPDVAAGASAVVADDGTVVFGGQEVDVAVQAVSDGVRVQTILASSDAPSQYEYAFEGFHPILNRDGTVSIAVTAGGVTVGVGELGRPWAYDATGRPVPTRYRVVGETVVQEIDHIGTDVAYPIVADPWYKGDCGIVTCTISFDRNTTRNIRDGYNLSAIASGVVGAILALTGVGVAVTVLLALVAAKLAVDAVFAGRYYENGNCFAYLFPRVPVFGLASFWPKEIRRGSRNCA